MFGILVFGLGFSVMMFGWLDDWILDFGGAWVSWIIGRYD